MLTASFRRKTVLVLLISFFAAFGLSASSGSKPDQAQSMPLEWAVMEFLDRVWSFLPKVQNEEECGIANALGCTSQDRRPQTKAGCHIDPDGRCVP